MPKTIRNKYYEYLTYEKLLEAHKKSRKGKGYRKEIILFNFSFNALHFCHNNFWTNKKWHCKTKKKHLKAMRKWINKYKI